MFKRMTIVALAAGALVGAGSGVALAGPEDPCWNGCSITRSPLLTYPFNDSGPLNYPNLTRTDPIPNTGITAE